MWTVYIWLVKCRIRPRFSGLSSPVRVLSEWSSKHARRRSARQQQLRIARPSSVHSPQTPCLSPFPTPQALTQSELARAAASGGMLPCTAHLGLIIHVRYGDVWQEVVPHVWLNAQGHLCRAAQHLAHTCSVPARETSMSDECHCLCMQRMLQCACFTGAWRCANQERIR